jgi:hypothetical protein
MKLHSTNYYNTFILVAEDCPTTVGEVPPTKNAGPTVANIQFEMVKSNPYLYSSDDVIFQVFAHKNDLTPSEYDEVRTTYYSKGQACLRASPLTKRYGWGVHHNQEGKIAIFARESAEYERFATDDALAKTRGMKSSR